MDELLEAIGFAIYVGRDTAEDDLTDGNTEIGPAHITARLNEMADVWAEYVREAHHEGQVPTGIDFLLYAHHALQPFPPESQPQQEG
jgi:hypothetical protein